MLGFGVCVVIFRMVQGGAPGGPKLVDPCGPVSSGGSVKLRPPADLGSDVCFVHRAFSRCLAIAELKIRRLCGTCSPNPHLRD